MLSLFCSPLWPSTEYIIHTPHHHCSASQLESSKPTQRHHPILYHPLHRQYKQQHKVYTGIYTHTDECWSFDVFYFLFKYILKCNLFLWCKAEFSASLLQSSVSHDPSEIILICWFSDCYHSNMLISYYYQCWKQFCCLTFLWKLWSIFFRILWWIESLK